MPARLVIAENAYCLFVAKGDAWIEIAVLAGGAAALLPAMRPVDEGALEQAIELAEDWLMPHASRLRGQLLEVNDLTGRLRIGLEDALSLAPGVWSLEEVEGIFLRLVGLTTGRAPSLKVLKAPLFVADVLMLRELAHHGQLRELRVSSP